MGETLFRDALYPIRQVPALSNGLGDAVTTILLLEPRVRVRATRVYPLATAAVLRESVAQTRLIVARKRRYALDLSDSQLHAGDAIRNEFRVGFHLSKRS